ncbi:MAG: multidrug efflux MFS transporter [Alphaproteobacteria bacterium]|nr:multidrug efflux MFS transporter [Alphaproteobacteria bacterium]
MAYNGLNGDAPVSGKPRSPRSWRLTVASCGLILAPAIQAADALIANVALPKIEADLGSGVELGAWVITSYLCATAVMAPLTGMLRRRYGARRLFPGAVGLFVIASVLCAMSPSGSALVISRILQGIGGGVIHPLAQAILLDIYPRERHGRIMAALGAGIMLGPILGPPLGGFVTDLASWRWVFLINLPLGLFAIACVWQLRGATEPSHESAIEPVAVGALVLGVTCLQLFLQRGVEGLAQNPIEGIAEGGLAAASFTVLILRARRGAVAVFRPEVFRDINFATATFYNFMLSALLFVTVVFLPALAEGPLAFPAGLAGALIVPRAMLLMTVMLLVGPLIGKIDHRILLSTGWVLMAAGLFMLASLRPSQSVIWIIIGSVVQSLGAGLLYIPLATLAFSTLIPMLRTDATGLYSLIRQLSYAAGVAIMTALLQARTLVRIADHTLAHVSAGARLAAYSDCFRVMGVASLVIIPAIFLFRAAPANES